MGFAQVHKVLPRQVEPGILLLQVFQRARLDVLHGGREFAALTPEVQAKLEQFANGRLPAAEQGELIERLSQNPEWIARLAADVKSLRSDVSKKP